jgi:hypothetical protein
MRLEPVAAFSRRRNGESQMKSTTSIAIALASALVAGCGGNHFVGRGFTADKICTADCGLTIAVGSGCVFQKSAIDTMVLTGSRGQRKLTWKLAEDSPYRFSKEFDYKGPIYIRGDARDPSRDPGDRFKNSHVSGDGKELIVTFEKKNEGTSSGTELTYYLNLLDARNADAKVWCEIDPWIVDR